jgi:hypothetical protein
MEIVFKIATQLALVLVLEQGIQDAVLLVQVGLLYFLELQNAGEPVHLDNFGEHQIIVARLVWLPV